MNGWFGLHGLFNQQSWTTQAATRPWNTKECHFFYWETSSFKQLNPTGCSMLTRGLGKAAILPWRFSELDARHLLEKVTVFGRLLDGMYLEPKSGTLFFCWYLWGGWSFKNGGHWGSGYVWMDEWDRISYSFRGICFRIGISQDDVISTSVRLCRDMDGWMEG